MRHLAIAIFSLFIFMFTLSPVSGQEELDTASETERTARKLEEQITEMGKEITRIVLQNLQALLKEELANLEMERAENLKETAKEVSFYEDALKQNPDDAAAHFSLGEIYDALDDGANAIIHTRKAESLFSRDKNIKGTAEARRNLRSFYRKYDYQPEDFKLTK